MHNPLIHNLQDFTITQLDEKVTELQRKYFMTRNMQVQVQIANLLDLYREELHTRRAIEYQRQKDQENGGSGLDKLINIS
jgi:hypothetical protein